MLSTPETPVEWAQRWLDALKRRDLAQLGPLTSYPFRFDDTGSVVGCKARAATSSEGLGAAIACLLEDALLTGTLQANPEPLLEQKKPSAPPRWAKRWRKELRTEDALVLTVLGDNGISYYFMLLVAADGVRSVFRHAEFWPN
jgi:hypothetical protein